MGRWDGARLDRFKPLVLEFQAQKKVGGREQKEMLRVCWSRRSWSASSSKSWSAAAAAAWSRAFSHYHNIQAVPREHTGSKIAVKTRAQGLIPAVVFSKGDIQDPSNGFRPISRKLLLTTERKQINSIIKTVQPEFFCSTLFNLQVRAGPASSALLESGNVLPIKVHRNAGTGQILNLIFVWADAGSELAVDVPVVFKGDDVCPGLKKGMAKNPSETPPSPTTTTTTTTKRMYSRNNHLDVFATCTVHTHELSTVGSAFLNQWVHEHILQKIEVDLSSLDIGDGVSMHDIKVDPSLKLLSKNDKIPICKIKATQSETP
ncbi:hypothetical protein ACLOJK_003056 [Asimina triloba]